MKDIYPKKINLYTRTLLKRQMPNLKKFIKESKNERKRINSCKTITNN